MAESTSMVVPKALEIFRREPLDMSMMQVEEVPFHPSSTFVPESGDITFEIKGSAEDYTNPALTYLDFGAQIQTATGGALADGVVVGPVNNAAHSFIQGVQVTVGNQVVYHEPHYPFRAIHTATQSYGKDARDSHLALSIFHKDTAGHMDSVTDNAGFLTRAALFTRSKIVQCRIHLDCDIFNIDKCFPNQLDMKVVLTRSRPSFCLMTPAPANDAAQRQYRVNIIKPVLWVSRVKVFPTISLMHNEALAAGARAEYNMVRVTTRPMVINTGSRGGTLDNVTSGQLPKRMWYGFIKNTAFNGNYQANPFNFEHMNVTSTSLYVDGKAHPIVPFAPIYPPAAADATLSTNWAREYWSLFTATGVRHGDKGIGISMADYPNGYCLYGFDISPNQNGHKASPVNLDKKGSTRIEIQCSAELTQAHVCIIYAEYDNVLKIDSDRNVYITY